MTMGFATGGSEQSARDREQGVRERRQAPPGAWLADTTAGSAERLAHLKHAVDTFNCRFYQAVHPGALRHACMRAMHAARPCVCHA